MIRALYTAVSGMITQESRQDIITNNMANVNTVGFKSDNLQVKSFKDVLLHNNDRVVNGINVSNIIGSLSQGSQIDGVATDFSGGTIQSTDSSTDFAIDGNGFFTVSRDNGISQQNYYTRDGHFHVNSDGYLVTDSGDKVLGRPVTINGNSVSYGALGPIRGTMGKVEGDANGLRMDGQSYKLDTVDFSNANSLKKVGDNLYQGSNPVDNPNIKVKQYSLEKSNVNVISCMTDMMTTLRAFESDQKVIQSIDETLDKSVNVVGSVR
ncbi:MAG: flagellar hook-basal body complex protein [Bacillota bacterium]|nr:flagellar hook-basal body complex protein [Bacillota bacterium]